MKKNIVKRIIASALATVLVVGSLAGCGTGTDKTKDTGAPASAPAASTDSKGSDASTNSTESAGSTSTSNTDGGTIMWMTFASSSIQIDSQIAYAESLCDALGYDFQIVYGDTSNDPAGNLKAVKDAMTDSVVGLIVTQDGGIANIMDEYPDLYVVGVGTDLNSVFGEGEFATSAKCLDNEKFLGTIADGHVNGEDVAKIYFEKVIEHGHKKVATMIFPAYAYPVFAAGEAVFRQLVEEYNQTASDADKIEIVGDPELLEFAPLNESYFLDKKHQDLDCIVAPLAGLDFIYPAMRSAVDAGNCSKDTKLITSGYTDDDAIAAEVGDGIVQFLTFSPSENIGWSITMLDKAIKGQMYDDFSGPERIDSLEYNIDSKEDMENVRTKSLVGTADASLAQISIEDLQAVTSYADLKALFMSDQLKVDALADR